MATSSLPLRAPGASGRTRGIPEPQPGTPSRELRKRAAGGWEKFMRRYASEQPDQVTET